MSTLGTALLRTFGHQKLSRRYENILLRWHARLDSPWSDRVLPWILAAVLFVIFSAMSLARLRALDAGADLASYTQAAWKLGQGNTPSMTIEGARLSQLNGALGFYPLSLVTRFFPIAQTLLVFQSAALALGVLPLWRMSRDLVPLRIGSAATMVAAYCLYPALHNLNLADFHPSALALPALLGAVHYGLSGHGWRLGVFSGIAIAFRVDLALALAGLGILIAVGGRRRLGLTLTGATLAWLGLALIVPDLGSGAGGLVYPDAFAGYGGSPLGVIGRLFTDPLAVIGAAVEESDFNVAVFLLAPVAFLPLVSFRYLLPVLPLHFFYVVGEIPEDVLRAELTVAVIPFVFLAAIHALSRIGRESVDRVSVNSRLTSAVLLAAIVFFARDAASSPYREPWDWGGRDQVDSTRLEASGLIDPAWSVRASNSLLPQLAERRRVYELEIFDTLDPQSATADGVVAIAVDESRLTTSFNLLEWDAFEEGLAFYGFETEPIYQQDPIRIYARGDVAATLSEAVEANEAARRAEAEAEADG